MKRNAYLLMSSSPLISPRRRSSSPVFDSLSSGRGPTSSRNERLAAFEREEPALRAEAAGVAAERAVARHYPMAGNDDRDRVGADRLARGARGSRVSGKARDPEVCGELAVRHPGRRGEDAPLERRERAQGHVDIERAPAAREIFVQLPKNRVPAPAAPGHPPARPP